MENYITLLVAFFAHLEKVTQKDAAKIVEHLKNSTIPSDFESAFKLVQEEFAKLEKK